MTPVGPQSKDALRIESEQDIVAVRKKVRDLCRDAGFGLTDVTRIVTAASELARNIFRYAKKGEMTWTILSDGRKKGIELVFDDQGPGIADVDAALGDGYTTSRSMGMGLPGTKRLMDDMVVDSRIGEGTTITIRKWTR